MKTMMNFERKIDFERKSNDLITIGELLIDMISEDYSDDHRGRVYHRCFGGSPSNVAINAKRLGIKSKIAAAVGNDGLGDYLIQTLLQEDMDISTIQRVDEPTSMVLHLRPSKCKHFIGKSANTLAYYFDKNRQNPCRERDFWLFRKP
jgi:fructokinase